MSFADHEKAKYWSSKNGDLKPEDVVYGQYSKSYWFKCPDCKHTFQQTVRNIRNDRWCPYCRSQEKKLCDEDNCKICFKQSFASHKRSKDWSDKNDITPREISIHSSKVVWFYCDKCNHDYDIRLDKVSKGNFMCPFCSSKRLCENNECIPCFNKSFASHKKSKYFSKKNKKDPRFLFRRSPVKYIFDCKKCKHSFESSLNNIIMGNWCSYCCIPTKILCNNNECKHCYERSFAPNKYAKYWSDRNKFTPRQVAKSSTKSAIFNCPDCNHTFSKVIAAVNAGKWCSYCSNQILCKSKKCKICFDKSMASVPYSINWSKKNKKTPREVFKGSNSKKYWFDCNKCKNSFDTVPINIKKGSGCPKCVNKTELVLYEWLDNNIEYIIDKQVKFEWCKNLDSDRYLYFDFVIEDLKLIIELDGEQHFEQIAKWKTPEYTRRWDIYKMKRAMENGYSVIRLLQQDVYLKKSFWKEELLKHIINNKKPTLITISGGDEYSLHLKDMGLLSESFESDDSSSISTKVDYSEDTDSIDTEDSE